MATVKYLARKKFKYDGKVLSPGDEWQPVGGKWDNSIKEHFIQVVEQPEPEQPKPKRRTRRKASGTSSK